MERNFSPRVIGACIVGFALVAGAYVLGTFGSSNFENQVGAAIAPTIAPRVAIAVEDSDNNGIEDWRDEFITTAPLVLDKASSTYELPTTLTGQLGISFIEDYIRAKNAGPFGADESVVVERAVETMAQQANYNLYDVPDITILSTWDDADILQYANTMALTITNNNVTGSLGEVDLLSQALATTDSDNAYLDQIKDIANAYQSMRDSSLSIPVPAFATKQHLDLINTYNALYESISAMALSNADPAFTLIRIKRYQDDATGLQIALQNMYKTLEPHAALLSPSDPALLFVLFSDEFNS